MRMRCRNTGVMGTQKAAAATPPTKEKATPVWTDRRTRSRSPAPRPWPMRMAAPEQKPRNNVENSRIM